MRNKISLFGWVCVLLVIFGIISTAVIEIRDIRDGCKPTGEQRLKNSMIHASDSALSTLVVEDKFVCKDGRITWKVRYD